MVDTIGTEDAKEQIVPYVESLNSRVQVERHLQVGLTVIPFVLDERYAELHIGLIEQELCGTAPFIATYLDRKFPLRMPPPAAPAVSNPSSRASGPTPSQAFPANIATKTTKSKKASTVVPTNVPARPIKNNKSGSSTPKPEDLAMAFGGMPGQVYIKNREDDLGWGGSGSKKKGSRAGTGANTPSIAGEGEDGTAMDRSRSLAGSVRGGHTGENPSASGSRAHSPDLKGKKLVPPEPERPKSREMKKIERMIEGVKKMADGQAAEAGKMDGQEGCFCMGEIESQDQAWEQRADIVMHCQPEHIPCPPILPLVLDAV